jgi:hypothetical protein
LPGCQPRAKIKDVGNGQHAGKRGKNKSHCFPFFYFPSFLKIGDFIYVKKIKQKNLLYIL